MPIYKAERFIVCVQRSTVEDPRVSCAAKGLLLVLNSFPEDEPLDIDMVMERCPETKAAVKRGLRELIRFGLVEGAEGVTP